MQFHQQEIPDPPSRCMYRADCVDVVRSVELLDTRASTMFQMSMPNSPGEEIPPERTAALVAAADFRNLLSAKMERRKPPVLRCASCVIDCALKVLQDGGAV